MNHTHPLQHAISAVLNAPTSPNEQPRYWWQRYVDTNAALQTARSRIAQLEIELEMVKRHPLRNRWPDAPTFVLRDQLARSV